MESRIPLPTDNIYKFYALFGLLLLIFSVGSVIFVNKTTNDLFFSKLVELEILKADRVPSDETQLRIVLTEKQLSNAKSDKLFYLGALTLLSAIGSLGIVYGFKKWHTEIQPLADQQAKTQLELAKMQLAKLQSELNNTKS